MPTKKPKVKLSDDEIEKYIEGIYNGSITEENLPENVYLAIAQYLEHAVYEGYGTDIKLVTEKDFDLLNQLRNNVYMFSAAKDYQQTKEISSLLIDEEGNVRTSQEFNKLARATYDTWTNTYGETEYSTALGQAYAAQKWNYIEEQKDVLPILEYKAISDPCDICAPLNGLTAPVDDPIWNTIAPLNHFNCKCIVIQHEEDEVKETPDKQKEKLFNNAIDLMQPLFKSNPGIDGMVFNEAHPYFDIARKDLDLANRNFDLPMPEQLTKKNFQKLLKPKK